MLVYELKFYVESECSLDFDDIDKITKQINNLETCRVVEMLTSIDVAVNHDTRPEDYPKLFE